MCMKMMIDEIKKIPENASKTKKNDKKTQKIKNSPKKNAT